MVILRALEHPDMADFEQWFSGASLDQLRKQGVDTTAVKSVSVTPTEWGETKRIELHNRAGEELDRILGLERADRTEKGLPNNITAGTLDVNATMVISSTMEQAAGRLLAAGVPVEMWPAALLEWAPKPILPVITDSASEPKGGTGKDTP